MEYIKLQLGCLLIITYLIVSYMKATKDLDRKNYIYNILMFVAPFAVFFDGLTAWSVNHFDLVNHTLNLFFHLCFFLFMNLMIIFTTMYMYDQLVGINKRNKKKLYLFLIPSFLLLILMICFIGQLDFLKGTTTNYSMGISVYISYISLVIHYGILLFVLLTRYRFLPKDKCLSTMTVIIMVGAILLIQILYPEVLWTSLFPTILLLEIYLDFENPFIRKLTLHNEEMIHGFATMVESRDNNTGGHIKRTRDYVSLLLDKMKNDHYYKDIMNKDYMTYVSKAAPLHDLGKIATPDAILQKPGKLTNEEYEIMKQHAVIGGEIVLNSFSDLDDLKFRQIAYEIARYHHEKYNGKGYPEGLKGTAIPLHARIMAIADVFDAISQKRCYRDALPLDHCFSIIEEGSGKDFDPHLVEIFLSSKEEIVKLMNKNE